MTDFDALEGEMHFFRTGERELERVLRGLPPKDDEGDGLAELAAFARGVRAAYLRGPADDVAEIHLAAIADAVAAEGAITVGTPRTGGSPGRRLAVRLAAVTFAALAAGASLALAGVRPPEPLSDAMEAIGIEVPGSDESVNEHPSAPSGSGGDGARAPLVPTTGGESSQPKATGRHHGRAPDAQGAVPDGGASAQQGGESGGGVSPVVPTAPPEEAPPAGPPEGVPDASGNAGERSQADEHVPDSGSVRRSGFPPG